MRILLVTAMVAAASGAFAQEPAFEALGQAPVVGGDRVRARERALDEALRQAVEQAVATVLTPDELVQRASQLKLRIYPRARSFVTTYRVLDEGETQPNVFQVHVSAQVATGQLQRELQQPSAPTGLPRLPTRLRGLVCVDAGGPPEAAPAEAAQAAEKAVRELLAARNVDVVTRPRGCTPEEAAAAARQEAAQAAVVGSGNIEAAGPIRGTSLEGAHARLSLKLVEPSGRASATGEGERDAYGPGLAAAAQAAVREATVEATRGLAPHLGGVWSAAPATGGVTVRLFGMTRFADYQAVARALAALPGVAAVEPRQFQRGSAELLVRTASGASQLEAGLGRVPPAGVRTLVKAQPDGSLRVEIAGDTAVPERG